MDEGGAGTIGLPVWDKSRYFATVRDAGTMEIFEVSTGLPVTSETLQQLSAAVGCTMKYK